MNNYDSDGPSDNEWDDRGELAWNEFDWELYLREQDEVITRYLTHYERLKDQSDRIDEVAHLMGWDNEEWNSDIFATGASDAFDDEDDSSDLGDDAEPYTIHKNPIYISTRSILFSLKTIWQAQAENAVKIPQKLAVGHMAALGRIEEQSLLAIQSLDFGDYAMAISLFKRALCELNIALLLFSSPEMETNRFLTEYRENAMHRFFDLREIWLRVMNECRSELNRPTDDDDE